MRVVSETELVRPDEACVSFSGRVSRFTPVVPARFTGVSGAVSPAGIDVEVDVRSLTTGNRAYDDVLSALDPFDVGRHPVARYRSAGDVRRRSSRGRSRSGAGPRPSR